MSVLGHRVGVAAAVIALGTCSVAGAQTVSDRRGYVAVKAGANHESAEDGLNATTGGGGVAVGFTFRGSWAVEAEIWVPGPIRDAAGDPEHRDIPVSASMIRFFRAGPSRPYLLAGLTTARTETHVTTCIADRGTPTIVSCEEPDVRERHRERFTSLSGYLLVGGGIEVPLGRRVRLAPEVRAHLAVTSVILRPAVAVIVNF